MLYGYLYSAFQLSRCDLQEHFEQHLLCLQPHFTRYVMYAGQGYQCGGKKKAISFFSPAIFRWGWEMRVRHLVLMPHHSLEMMDGLMYRLKLLGLAAISDP